MNILVIYYSKTGKTQKVAQMMYRVFKERGKDVDIFRIKPAQQIGWIKSILYTIISGNVDIRQFNKDISAYDLIVIGGPVWCGLPAVFVNSFIDRIYSFGGKKVVSYMTLSTNKSHRAISAINKRILNKDGHVVLSKAFRIKGAVNRQILEEVKTYTKYILEQVIPNTQL